MVMDLDLGFGTWIWDFRLGLVLDNICEHFYFGFSLHFPQNRGRGSDPSVKNVTLFF